MVSFKLFALWALLAVSAGLLLRELYGINAARARGDRLLPQWWRPIALWSGYLGMSVYQLMDGNGVIANIIWVPAFVLLLLGLAKPGRSFRRSA